MPAIVTSTAATATAYSNQRKVDRCQNGVLWAFPNFVTSPAVQYASIPAYSTDNGATWTAVEASAVFNGSGSTSATYVRNLSFFIDIDDFAHVVFKDNGNGFIYYRRGTPNAERTAWTWSSAQLITSNAVAANHPDIVAHREGTGWRVHIVLSYHTGSTNLVDYYRLSVSDTGTFSGLTNSTISANYGNGNATWPSIDFNHTGDGKTVAGGTPHLYAAWSAGTTGSGFGIRFRRAAYSGGTWTWGTEREIDHLRSIPSNRFLNCMFDGTRVIIPASTQDNAGGHDVVLYERDAADTTTTTRVLLDQSSSVSANAMDNGSSTYDAAGNVYFLGRTAESPRRAFYQVWNRGSGVFDNRVFFDTNSGDAHISAKRGHSGNRLIEWIYTDGTASPYTITFESLNLNATPTAPTLVAPANTSSVSKSSPVGFDWTHNDADGDPQSAYALVRKRRP